MLSLMDVAPTANVRTYRCSYCFREERLPQRGDLRRPLCRRCEQFTQLGLVKLGASAETETQAAPHSVAASPSRRLLSGAKTGLIGLLVLAAVIAATRLLMAIFVSAASAASLALPAASMSIAQPETIDLMRERAWRVEAIERYDRFISRTRGDPALQTPWLELKQRDLEELQLLEARLPRETQLASERPRPFLDR